MYTTTSPSFISIDAFMSIVAQQLGKTLNPKQQQAVEADSDESLFLVAGPGSGKTTVLTLRVLKLIFVDSIEPGAILATTFTRRAAAELRSRILGWGDQIRHVLLTDASPAQRAWLRKLDLNQTLTGTLDSLAEQVLRDFRGAGMQPPVVLDEFIARALMFREGVLDTGAYDNRALKDYLARLCRDGYMPVQHLGSIISEIRQRIISTTAWTGRNFAPVNRPRSMICFRLLTPMSRNCAKKRRWTSPRSRSNFWSNCNPAP